MKKNSGLRIFEGAQAIVTGGASGIGLALSKALAARGCEVVLADLQSDLAGNEAESIRAKGGRATSAELDVRDFHAVERLVNETADRAGRLDYMFNNAGIGLGGDTHCYTIQDWNNIIDVNLRGVVNGLHAAYLLMLKQGFGQIVNIASTAALGPTPLSVGYSTTKHAVLGLSYSLRAEAADARIRINVICPGVIRTPILEGGKYGRIVGNMSREKMQEMWKWMRPMDPDVFAEKALRLVALNRAIIVVPFAWNITWWLTRLSPELAVFVARRLNRLARKHYGLGPISVNQ